MKKNNKGFTLIELLTVIAIIGILAGIIIPSVGAVRNSAKKAKTQSMFSQWASAVELFRQEYGYYPFGTAAEGAISINGVDFVGLLEGTSTDGPNTKGIRYYSFPQDAFDDPEADDPNIIDAFGNDDIYMLVDANRDGKVTFDGSEIRTSVLFYTVEDNSQDFPEIRSWE